MKFEEAYSIYDNETLSIETIKTIYNQDPRAYIENYKFSFFCPECHLAQLSYINAVVPYFRAYPKAKHHENCDLQQDERSRKSSKNLCRKRSKYNNYSERDAKRTLFSICLSFKTYPCSS